MRSFFGELLCECQSVTLHEFAMTTPDGEFQVSELYVVCIDCKATFYESADVVTRLGPASRPNHAGQNLARGATADHGERMATAKKTATKTTRGRNQDRALVASMEDYEVKYLATKHGVTQKVVKEAVAKVGHSRDKVEKEIKAGKSS